MILLRKATSKLTNHPKGADSVGDLYVGDYVAVLYLCYIPNYVDVTFETSKIGEPGVTYTNEKRIGGIFKGTYDDYETLRVPKYPGLGEYDSWISVNRSDGT